MYQLFFGLRERPFDLSPNPRCLVLTESHREAIGNIEYAIASRTGITLLLGQAGSGKTTVIRAAIARQPTLVHCVHLTNLALTRPEFIETLACSFGLSQRAQESKAILLSELEALLRRRHQADEITALIVDEAQTLPLELLEEIRLLGNIETNDQKLLSVILAGQPELGLRLDDPSFSQLKQRLALWCELRPLTFKETATYMLSRIEWAGGSAAKAFTIEAVRLIHDASNGIPRIINVIADNALMTGYASSVRPVNSQIVAEVCRDFRIRHGEGVSAESAAAKGQQAEPGKGPVVSFPPPRTNLSTTGPSIVAGMSHRVLP